MACGADESSPGSTGGTGGTGGAGGVGGQTGGSAGDGGATGGSGGAGGNPIEGQTVDIPVGGVSARWAYEEAYDNVADGAWYRDSHNETATLAWGESYVMMSLAAMFRATGSPLYLERLSWHIDGVLAQRDDQRGVSDYRNVSGACWQNHHYQPNDEAYCYVVHSGMLGTPMAEFARLVGAAGLAAEPTEDGSTFGAKATAYVAAAEATVAYHDDQWNEAGYYVFRPDASFLSYPVVDLPLNQSNAMGRLLLVLHEVTGNAAYLDKATKLATRFDAQITTGSSGEALWNYWGGSYNSPGEDISHAAINIDFAAMAADQGVVFDGADVERFAQTFMERVYVDDHTLSDHVGGGATNGSSYRPQIGRWLRLARERTAVYAAVRDIYDLDYPADAIGSGSLLHGWASLAEHEPIACEHYFYVVDWDDPDPQNDGDWREATAYGANILTVPPAYDAPCVIPLEIEASRPTEAQQWDGTAYHAETRWQATGGQTRRLVPYEPRWPHDYDGNGGVLFQFADSFVQNDGIRVKESSGIALPQIGSSPPTTGEVGTPLGYAATGSGDAPLWWALSTFPVEARIDHTTGAVDWTPPGSGDYAFTVVLQSNW
ncbi:MAG: hypothetical protein JRI68_24960, partial [Deltaproteobacteria bacterium]|nr:hypothetical protein [Deltaproteobacteria bacterium]